MVGDPRQLITDYVDTHPVDLVVVGRRGRGAFKRWAVSPFVRNFFSYGSSDCASKARAVNVISE